MLPFIIVGLVSGSVYGLTGVGLVLTYKTSGIFNFAQGALGTLAAYIFYFLYVQHHVPLDLSATLAILVLGIALGLGFEQFARRVSRTSLAVQIAATVGMLLIVQSLALIFYGPVTRPFPQFLPTNEVSIAGAMVGVDQIIIFVISLLATLVLCVFFRRARVGKAMRAVVDNPDLLDLAGTSPTQVRRWAWVIGCVFATLSGLLLAPSVNLNAVVLTLLMVQALGAAAIGGFSNLPLTWIGGLIIGVIASLITEYVNSSSIIGGLSASLPFIVLFLVILFFPKRRLANQLAAPIRRTASSRSMPGRVQIVAGLAVFAFLCCVPNFAGFRLGGWTLSLTYVIVLLSLGLLVRTSGQVSLCQVTFAAIGAVAFSKLAQGAGIPWIPALIIAGLVAVPVGALLAIPASRLPGLYLALATFGFGLLVENMFYNSNIMFGANDVGLSEPLPSLSWISVGTTTGFYYVVLALTTIISVLVVILNRSRLGRLLRGLSDSPTALSTSGAAVNVTRVLVFCISAFIASIGGALAGMTLTQVTGASYDPMSSLTYLAVIVIVVGSEPWYALLAGAGVGLIPTYFNGGGVSYYLQLVFGSSAVLVAVSGTVRLPESWSAAFERLGGRRHLAVATTTAAAERDTVAPRVPACTLEVRQLRVAFGGLIAVDGLDLTASTGQITGLIGPNGAGKTTTFNACSGLHRPTSGQIILNGKNISRLGPAGRARRGLGRTFQQVQLFDSLNVVQNVSLGLEAAMAGANPITQLMSRPSESVRIKQEVAEAIELCGLVPFAEMTVSELSTGQRRLVELARCLAGPFSLLLLDEPSSGLDRGETERFGNILSEVVEQRRLGILLVEHDVALVMDVCDRIYVLDFGELIFEGGPEEARASTIVRDAYLGNRSSELESVVANARDA